MEFFEANYTLDEILYELTLALREADAWDGHPHMAWHMLPPHLQRVSLADRSEKIQYILIPACVGHGSWESLIPKLKKIVFYLRFIQEGPFYGCSNCL